MSAITKFQAAITDKSDPARLSAKKEERAEKE